MFFEYPKILWLEIIPVLLIIHYLYLELAERKPHLRVSTSVPWKLSGGSVLGWIRHLPFAFRILAVVMIIIAMARPRSSQEMDRVDTEGIDIMLTMDVSTSMLARDFKPDRISAAKDIAIEFISQRPSDRIGVVVFAGESYTQCPLTIDHSILMSLYETVDCQMAANGTLEDGTAIGDGIMNSLIRLRDSKAKSKVLILLTDGVNNRGNISPMTAAEIAKKNKVRIYTVGIGKNGMAMYPLPTGGTVMMPTEIDEKTMTDIAELTGGKYFRAKKNSELEEIYREIDKMERTKFNVTQYSKRNELYEPFAVAALIVFLLELLMRLVVLKRLP